MIRWLLLLGFAALLPAGAFELPAASSQCIVAIAPDWNSSHATLRFYQKCGGAWQQQGDPWEARLGRDGLVWGRGLHPLPQGTTCKREGDWRAPAGVFTLGGVWGYAASVPKHRQLAYHQVTSRDLWIEDPASPLYNCNVALDHDPLAPWEKKQQMKQNDPAHALKLFIGHNAPPHAVPGAGSSIFFHIWRDGGNKPSAGCTTMAENRLRTLIQQLDPTREPLYVLLPKAEYARYRAVWRLP